MSCFSPRITAVLAVVAIALPLAAAAGPRYRAHELVDAAGVALQGNALNDAGAIAGLVGPDDLFHPHLAFVSDRRHLRTFGDPETFITMPLAMNEQGDIAGYVHDGQHGHAFVDSRGKAMRLLVPGATDSYAYGINASGMVTVAADNRGYVWQHGVFTRIRAGGGVPVQPGGINDAGVVVGQVYQGTQDAFVWQNGVLTKLPRLPGANDDNQAAAVAINDSGVIVGYCMLAAHYHPCRWVDGQVEDLGLFPGGDQGFALAVNDAGEVVGRSFAPGEHSYRAHAFIYRDGEMLDLQKLVVDLPRHVFLANAVAINNRGEIVVQAYEDEPLIDSHHYFLLTPTDAD